MSRMVPQPPSMPAIDCLTGRVVAVDATTGHIGGALPPVPEEGLPFTGPGLVDLQVNGVGGIDFNAPGLSVSQLEEATHLLLAEGTTTFFPTIVTNANARTVSLLKAIATACSENRLVDQCIGGIHLEGPFISRLDGARGAHPRRHVKAPDWDLFQRFQEASGQRIRLITLSPEWPGAAAFIARCVTSGVRVAIGHSLATPAQLEEAVAAGATLSTHLGNAVPLMLPRHPNIIWEQLANDGLYASIIADGIHLPDSVMRVILKTKGKKCLLVSDGTSFTGLAPGEYQSHIGGKVVLDAGGRLSIAGGKGLLAGAAKPLIQNVAYLATKELASWKDAWAMASLAPAKWAGLNTNGDRVVFSSDAGDPRVLKVFKAGSPVAFK